VDDEVRQIAPEGVEFVGIAGAGHMIPWDDTADFVVHTRAFWPWRRPPSPGRRWSANYSIEGAWCGRSRRGLYGSCAYMAQDP
jgi:hypothetical protein